MFFIDKQLSILNEDLNNKAHMKDKSSTSGLFSLSSSSSFFFSLSLGLGGLEKGLGMSGVYPRPLYRASSHR
jgi:hypothetical protein